MDKRKINKALVHLAEVDPVMGDLIARVGPFAPNWRTEGEHFDHVLRSIVYQQLSGKAASTIHGRVLALYGDRAPTPAELLATPDEALRACGLSRQKISYAKDLAHKTLNENLAIDRLHELSDDEVIATLVAVKGVGRWTAQMVLMFRLGRLDVLPDLDLGIQKGMQLTYRMRKLPTPKRVLAHGAKWAPYRTVASWYLWRSLELPRAPGTSKAKARTKAQTRAKTRAKTSKTRSRSQ